MKKCLLLIFCMLTAMTSSAVTRGTDVLGVDSIALYGNRLAQMIQVVQVGVRNTTAADYAGRLYLTAYDKNNGKLIPCLDTLINLKGYEVRQLLLRSALPEGEFQVRITTDAEGLQVLGYYDVTILPLRKLNLQATLSLDMLTEADGEQILYGSRIKGWVRVENYDTPYYGASSGIVNNNGIMLWMEDRDTHERLFMTHVANKLELWSKAEYNFSHDVVFRDGARYLLKVGYGMPYGLEPIDSLCFTTRMGTNTYWTASGEVLPLPLGTNQQLTIPEEAVAVDLRGQHTFNTVFSIDASRANPNCLYYLDFPDKVPQGLDGSHNLVQGLEADCIKLTEGRDYFCPLAFHTQFISYRMTPSYNNPDNELYGRGYSETLVLPFYPSHVCLYDINGNTDVLHADMLKVLRYYGNIGDSLNISELSSLVQMEAYVPYILGVYIGSSLLFIGEDTQVPMTREAIARGASINFVGTTVGLPMSAGSYVFDPVGNRFLVGDEKDVTAPFHAYMQLADDKDYDYDRLDISASVWGDRGTPDKSTAIDDVPSYHSRSDRDDVYDLSGRQIVNRESVNRQLPKGIYIIGGQKVVVK